MSDEEIRIVIAESVGWKFGRGEFGSHTIISPSGTGCGHSDRNFEAAAEILHLPNYATDINAMHEVIHGLTAKQRHAYAVLLSLSVWPAERWNDYRDTLAVSEATARQRAEAYLKAIGK